MVPDPGDAIAVADIVAWLTGPLTGVDIETILARLGPDLVGAGVRLTRIAAFVRTLHPVVMGRRIVWSLGAAVVEVRPIPYEILNTAEYLASPSGQVVQQQRELRWRLDGAEPLEYQALRSLRDLGMTDYLALPMQFVSGDVHALTYATDASGGFTDSELAKLRAVTGPLSRLVEIVSLARNAANLLDAYVGHNAGERILSGRVRRGETERIHCVIWFSDLRGFTQLSATRAPESTIELLNRLFDCQVPAIQRHGGEVLKFMGDGMLAIFLVRDPKEARGVVGEALLAAEEAFAELDHWNAGRTDPQDPRLRFGLAIHLGDVAYGNIGSAGRLDFTCIGPAVNLAARVEAIAAKLGKRVLLTEAAAKVTDVPTHCLGAHEAKGVDHPPVVYELDAGWSSMSPASLASPPSSTSV